ncbi:MAG: NAD-dependent epimerase/dehydratase family protein [Thermoleophilaceae bacterium]|nr:NAD-dependent epimerase/dehydratase family protein [Thermoleophilaceae bacterium]
MKAFVTGGTGFIGGALVRRLRTRGDEVAALVRSPQKAGALRELGCAIVEGEVTDAAAVRRGLEGCDACFHVAAIYEVGIPASRRRELWDANVCGTEVVLDAAIEAGTPRVVYVSTLNVYGNTRGKTVDETYERPLDEGFLSVYDETKWRAHGVARERIDAGAPVVIVQPGAVYGPGDHSELGNLIEQTRSGRMLLRLFPDTGFNLVHVDDVAEGIVLAHDKGRTGESYNLGGPQHTMGELVDKTAEIAGRRPPRIPMPAPALKAAIPIGPLVGRLLGFPPNLAELIHTMDGVTIWGSSAKAERELGWRARDLDTGLRETLAAAAG